MLEYYTMNADYIDSLVLTEALFTALLEENKAALLRFQTEDELDAVRPPFIRLTMEDAFIRYAGFSLGKAIERGTLRQEAESLGMNIAPQFSDADIYNIIFIDKVEPALPREKPVALLDYPAIVPTLAQKKPGAGGKDAACFHRRQFTEGKLYKQNPQGCGFCDRWELYVRGIETANCYSEETDAEEVRRYFERESAEKAKAAAVPHAVDADYWRIFAKNGGFPRCSGVAVGMDRLIMALAGKRDIAEVRKC